MTLLRRREILVAGTALVAASALPRAAFAAPTIVLTSVKFGSVSWLIETIRAEGLDKKHGFDLK
ncbi:MAG: ABC transporter substrate-binding protein, partial [Hyphomicrobium sp.]